MSLCVLSQGFRGEEKRGVREGQTTASAESDSAPPASSFGIFCRSSLSPTCADP